MIDLNHNSLSHTGPLTFSDHVNQVIDAAILQRRKNEPPRNYLGMSQIGHLCERYLCYEYAHTPVDEGKEFTARTLRIFDTGHAAEDAMAIQIGAEDTPENDFFSAVAAKWVRDSGFQLVTRGPDGKQFECSALSGKFAGHTDGDVLGGPPLDWMPYPLGWEHKSANKKNWNKLKKYGVREASPVYYGQMQCYMAYRGRDFYWFMATNKDTQELHHELIPLVPKEAQALSDKALRVIRSVETENLLPRCTDNPDYWICAMCSRRRRCWDASA